jgi:hypothetical protein
MSMCYGRSQIFELCQTYTVLAIIYSHKASYVFYTHTQQLSHIYTYIHRYADLYQYTDMSSWTERHKIFLEYFLEKCNNDHISICIVVRSRTKATELLLLSSADTISIHPLF